MLYVQSWTPGGGRKDRPKHVECYYKINKFEKQVHLVGFTIEIYYDARTYERQNYTDNCLCGQSLQLSVMKIIRPCFNP